jgi:HlyD family secretion protein
LLSKVNIAPAVRNLMQHDVVEESLSTSRVTAVPALAAVGTNGKSHSEANGSPRVEQFGGRGLAWKLLAAVGVIALLATGLGLGTWGDKSLPDEITATVKRSELPITVTESGELESSQTVEVRCEVEGEQIRITEAIPEGTRVSKGQVVIRFDTEKLSRSLAEQEVKWRNAQAKSQAAEEDLAVAKNTAESEVGKADLVLRLATIDLRKYQQGDYPQEKLTIEGEILLAEAAHTRSGEVLAFSERMFRKGYVSAAEVEANRATVTNAEKVLKIAQEKLRVLNEFTYQRQVVELTAKSEDATRELERTKRSQASKVAKAQSDFVGARDTAAIEKSLMEKLQQQVERCTVTAPQEGILVYDKSRPWDAASRIQAGGIVTFQRTLFSLPDLKQMQVKVKIHESAVKKVQVGQQAELRVDADADVVLHGVVERVATLAESRGYWDQRGVKEYETIVKIVDLPTESGLRPGMTAEVKVHVSHLRNVLVVPIQAVAEKNGEHSGYVVNGSSVKRRHVSIGENNEKFVEIKDGLAEGELVTLDALARLDEESGKTKADDSVPSKPEKAEKGDAPRITAANSGSLSAKAP